MYQHDSSAQYYYNRASEKGGGMYGWGMICITYHHTPLTLKGYSNQYSSCNTLPSQMKELKN